MIDIAIAAFGFTIFCLRLMRVCVLYFYESSFLPLVAVQSISVPKCFVFHFLFIFFLYVNNFFSEKFYISIRI